MTTPAPIDLAAAVESLRFLPDRTPTMGGTEDGWAAELSQYRDGGIYVVHYAGESEWERHQVGDEIVLILEGSTTMTMCIDGEEHRHTLGPMQMIIVPQGTWHRFEAPVGVKVMTVTPQPTDHRVEHPNDG